LVVRERVRQRKAAVGRLLVEVPSDTFRLWVTNRSEAAPELWRDKNGRAGVEQGQTASGCETVLTLAPPGNKLSRM
jgi:hypothetical protein